MIQESSAAGDFTVTIRPEDEGDHAAVRQINLRAFETNLEADLVDAVRPTAKPLVSLVAELDGAAAGENGGGDGGGGGGGGGGATAGRSTTGGTTLLQSEGRSARCFADDSSASIRLDRASACSNSFRSPSRNARNSSGFAMALVSVARAPRGVNVDA